MSRAEAAPLAKVEMPIVVVARRRVKARSFFIVFPHRVEFDDEEIVLFN
jgi:hypothetical protein